MCPFCPNRDKCARRQTKVIALVVINEMPSEEILTEMFSEFQDQLILERRIAEIRLKEAQQEALDDRYLVTV
jgi:hypothetical protein